MPFLLWTGMKKKTFLNVPHHRNSSENPSETSVLNIFTNSYHSEKNPLRESFNKNIRKQILLLAHCSHLTFLSIKVLTKKCGVNPVPLSMGEEIRLHNGELFPCSWMVNLPKTTGIQKGNSYILSEFLLFKGALAHTIAHTIAYLTSN